jgi:hypothetical protein
MPLSSAPEAAGSLDLPQPPRKNGPWRVAFRIFCWATYVSSALTLILLLHKAAPPPVEAASPEAAARVEQKFALVEQSLNTGQAATVRLDEPELNSYLASHLNLEDSSGAPAMPPQGNSTNAPNVPSAGGPAGSPTQEEIESARSSVRDVKIQLMEDRVRAYILFDMHGKDMTLQLEGRLSSSGGYIRFDPVGGEIGSLPIPRSALETAVQRMMDSPVNRETLRLPPNISDLRVENGEIVLTYR